jgi:hypothetical protein
VFSLVAGSGDADNASFAIVDSELQTALPLDFEAQSNLSIRVRAQDLLGGSFEKTFAVSVTDVNEPPVVTIGEPADGASFGLGDPVDFAATAIDPEEGDVSVDLVWDSDLDTSIGAGAAFTTSSLSEGLHAITASVTDSGGLTGSDQRSVEVASGQLLTTQIRVSDGLDDAEERAGGSVSTGSSDLELVFDGSNQIVGMRFSGVAIPADATVTEAWIQFQADEVSSGSIALTLRGEASDDAGAFAIASDNLSDRPVTSAQQGWSPLAWDAVGDAGLDQRTPDLAPLIQEIVEREGWSSGNALVILLTGTGERVAESYNGDPSAAPLLFIEYRD